MSPYGRIFAGDPRYLKEVLVTLIITLGLLLALMVTYGATVWFNQIDSNNIRACVTSGNAWTLAPNTSLFQCVKP